MSKKMMMGWLTARIIRREYINDTRDPRRMTMDMNSVELSKRP